VIVDAFPYAYGPEILLIRLHELAGVVDRHLIVEADTTHTGRPRTPHWPELRNDPLFAPFRDRVDWSWVEVPRSVDRPIVREGWIRSAVLDAVRGMPYASDDLWVLFGDHDEIPHPEAMSDALAARYPAARLLTRYHEWYLNLRASGGPHLWEFRQPMLFTLEWAAPYSGEEMRARQIGYRAAGTGWHLTLQGGADAVAEKLRTFAHTEMSRFTAPLISALMEQRRDILDRAPLELVPDEELPRAALELERRGLLEGMLIR